MSELYHIKYFKSKFKRFTQLQHAHIKAYKELYPQSNPQLYFLTITPKKGYNNSDFPNYAMKKLNTLKSVISANFTVEYENTYHLHGIILTTGKCKFYKLKDIRVNYFSEPLEFIAKVWNYMHKNLPCIRYKLVGKQLFKYRINRYQYYVSLKK